MFSFLDKGGRTGATFVELVVSMSVYMLLSVTLLVILRMGINSWKVTEHRTETETWLNKAYMDLDMTVGNSSASSLFSSYCSDTGDGWFLCSSASKIDDDIGIPEFLEHEFDFDFETKSSVWNFKVLYFTAKDSPCSECMRLFGNSDYCPHKRLVKRWHVIPESSLKMLRWDSVSSSYVSNTGEIVPCSGAPVYAPKPYDKILAGNVMAFRPSVASGSLSYSIKALNTGRGWTIRSNSEVRDSIRFLNSDLVMYDERFYRAVGKDPLGELVVQVNGSVTAMN